MSLKFTDLLQQIVAIVGQYNYVTYCCSVAYCLKLLNHITCYYYTVTCHHGIRLMAGFHILFFRLNSVFTNDKDLRIETERAKHRKFWGITYPSIIHCMVKFSDTNCNMTFCLGLTKAKMFHVLPAKRRCRM